MSKMSKDDDHGIIYDVKSTGMDVSSLPSEIYQTKKRHFLVQEHMTDR